MSVGGRKWQRQPGTNVQEERGRQGWGAAENKGSSQESRKAIQFLLPVLGTAAESTKG